MRDHFLTVVASVLVLKDLEKSPGQKLLARLIVFKNMKLKRSELGKG